MIKQFTFGLIGERIGYSRSPVIFRTIFREDGAGGSFTLYDLPVADFERGFREILQAGVQGLAVTIPHKERVAGILDRLHGDASVLRVVNSIVVERDIVGYNTDVAGFVYPLRRYRGRLAGGSALVLGAGGGARAAVWALHQTFGVERVVIVTRSAESLESILRLFENVAGLSLDGCTYDRAAEALAGSYSVAVNATPLGGFNYPELSPLPADFLWDRIGFYYDLNYNDDNQVVAQASAAGVTALDGSHMLVAQAVESYRLWTGRTVEVKRIYTEVFGDARRNRTDHEC